MDAPYSYHLVSGRAWPGRITCSFSVWAQDILVGLLRLRKCGRNTTCPELIGRCSIVRELHVYGTAVPVHGRDADKLQHQVNAVIALTFSTINVKTEEKKKNASLTSLATYWMIVFHFNV